MTELTPETFDDNLRKVVRTLMAWRGRTIEDTAAGVGIAKSSMYQRLAPWSMSGKKVQPTSFSAREVWRLAQWFGVHEAVFFRSVEDLIPGADPAHNGASATKV